MTENAMSAQLRVVTIREPSELTPYLESWDRLSEEAAEPNVFYESWMLLPALRHIAQSQSRPEIILVLQGQEVRGLFPIQRSGAYKGFPLGSVSLWKHEHCYLCTPLVHRDLVAPVIDTVLAHLRSASRASKILVCNTISTDGPVGRALGAACAARSCTTRTESFERAFYTKKLAPEEHLQAAISGRHRRDFSRLEKRLEDQGTFQYEALGPDSSPSKVDAWIEEFLEIETTGWKGREGTAMKCKEADATFFREIVRDAAKRGKAYLSAARVDGKAIAMKCVFASGPGSFAFKIAYDEAFQSYRPGILLEIWYISEIYKSPPEWMDSCAEPNHSMLNRLLIDRRSLATQAVALRLFPEGALVAAVPLLKRLRNRFRKAAAPKSASGAVSGAAASQDA